MCRCRNCPDAESCSLDGCRLRRFLADLSAPSEHEREDALLAAHGLDADPPPEPLDGVDLDPADL